MNEEQIPIRLNGREHAVAPGRTLAELLAELDLDERTVVVELNREIVRREELDDRALEEGDEVEVVHFVGGGAPRLAGDAPQLVGGAPLGSTSRSRHPPGPGEVRNT